MDGLLASLFSTGDTLKRQLRGLLANPVGEAQQNLLSVGDTSRQHLQDLAASGGLGVLGSDPAYRQAAQNRVQASTVDAAMNAVTPLTVGKLNLLKLSNRELNALSESALREVPEDVLQKLIARQGKAGQATGHFRGEIARRNAVKELGLPAENTAADRARKIGFQTAPSKATYHGARGDIQGPIDPAMSDFGFHTGTLDQAEHRLKAFATPGEVYAEGGNVIPLLADRYANLLKVKDEGSFHADALAPQLAAKGIVSREWAKKVVKDVGSDWKAAKEYDDLIRRTMEQNGYDGIKYQNAQEGAGASFAFSNPSRIRSRFAAFDPAQRNSPNLLASYSPLGLLTLGGLLGGYNED